MQRCGTSLLSPAVAVQSFATTTAAAAAAADFLQHAAHSTEAHACGGGRVSRPMRSSWAVQAPVLRHVQIRSLSACAAALDSNGTGTSNSSAAGNADDSEDELKRQLLDGALRHVVRNLHDVTTESPLHVLCALLRLLLIQCCHVQQADLWDAPNPSCMQHTEGWSTRAIQLAAKDLQYSPALAGVCKDESELVAHFIRKCNHELFEKMRQQHAELEAQSDTIDKLRLAVRWRLELLAPYAGAHFI